MHGNKITKLCSHGILILAIIFPSLSFAISAPFIPSTTQPERISQELTPLPTAAPTVAPPLKRELPKEPEKFGKEAEKITFKLTKIILEGNCVFSTQQLQTIYQKKLHTKISIAELQQIVQSISDYYRNKGYILTRAVLPPQRVKKDGVIHVKIIEGYIDQVHVIGKVKGFGTLIRVYGCMIRASRPLKLSVLEKYLLLANQIPGVQVRSVLEPAKNAVGASDLNLIVNTSRINGYLSYDNYGTRYLGPQQFTGNLQFNSIFRSGDSTSVTYVTTARPQELRYVDINHMTPWGCSGGQFVFDYNQALTIPQFVLQPFQVNGKAENYYVATRYPLIVTLTDNLTVEAGFNYMDSNSTTLGFLLYNDHIRSLRFITTYNFSDRFAGANLWNLQIERGLPWLGATTDTTSLTTSRFGGTANFLKFNAQISRYQPIRGRYSVYLQARGQYSCEPLLSASQFGYGGYQLGRGYDPSEIIGDLGAAGSIELRADYAPGLRLLQAFQLYSFYDEGAIWNRKNVIGVKRKQSAASIGIGSRFNFNQYLSGNFMYTQPLTRQVAALQLIGDGRQPRAFFSITAAF